MDEDVARKATKILGAIHENRPEARPWDDDLKVQPIGSYAQDNPDYHTSYRIWEHGLPDDGLGDALAQMESSLRAMSVVWRDCAARPKPSKKAIMNWRNLLRDWIADRDLPLLIRKGGLCGTPHVHATGRDILLTDNSPAQWAYAGAVQEMSVVRGDVYDQLRRGTLPVAQVLSAGEAAARRSYIEKTPNPLIGGPLGKSEYGNMNAWKDGRAYKLAHIEPVGLRQAKQVAKLPIEMLEAAMFRFLDPGNIYVVPKAFAGVAETEAFSAAFEGYDAAGYGNW